MGENFIIIAQQVLVLFILIAVGFICGKKKIITDFSARHMTDIVLYVVTPCVMISAFQREFSFELLSGLIICVTCSALIFAVSILICNLIFMIKMKAVRLLSALQQSIQTVHLCLCPSRRQFSVMTVGFTAQFSLPYSTFLYGRTDLFQ